MATIEEQRENTIAAIELVVKEFLNVDTIGKWFSVRERSLGNLMKQLNLDIGYSSFIYDELKSIGLIEKEGRNSGIRYKVITNVIPDFRAMAERIYTKRSQAKKEYFESKKSDFVPHAGKRYPTINEFEQRENKRKRKQTTQHVSGNLHRIPRLGEIVYAVVDGQITEAKITCVRFDESEKILVNFVTPITKSNTDGVEVAVAKTDWRIENISFSVEEIMKKLQNNICKFSIVEKKKHILIKNS